MAYALVDDAIDGAAPIESLALFDAVSGEARGVVAQMLERDLNAPAAHGVGRYFDAFGALARPRPQSSYEGQVAHAWDVAADEGAHEPNGFELDEITTPPQIDLRPAVREAVGALLAGASPGVISGRFHATLVEATAVVTEQLLGRLGPLPVALTGGVFQNSTLCSGVQAKLHNKYKVLRHQEVPPGDGGIALGQALIADAFLGDKG